MCDTHCGQMDDALRGHRAPHEADKLQLRTMLRNRSHGSISDLEERKEYIRNSGGGERAEEKGASGRIRGEKEPLAFTRKRAATIIYDVVHVCSMFVHLLALQS